MTYTEVKRVSTPYLPLKRVLTKRDFHVVTRAFLFSNVVIAAFQVTVLVLAIAVWRSTYIFLFYLPFMVVEWFGALFVSMDWGAWTVEEFGKFKIGQRFYFCELTRDGSRLFSKFRSMTFFFLFIYILIWLRPIMLLVEADSFNGVSSCTRLEPTAQQFRVQENLNTWSYNPNGKFPHGGDDFYVKGRSVMFCPLDLRWGSDNGEQIKGYTLESDGSVNPKKPVEPGYILVGPYARDNKESYPNPGVGAIGLVFGETDLHLNNEDLAQCPALTSRINEFGLPGLGVKVCSSCLQMLRDRTTGAASSIDGLSDCAYDPELPVSFFCNFCPRIFPSIFEGNEGYTVSSLRSQAIWTGLITFSPILRQITIMLLSVYIESNTQGKRE